MSKDIKKGPWTCHSSDKKYESPWLSVYHDEVTTPGDTQGIYGHIVFKNKAVGIIPLDENDNTWLVRQYRYTLDEYSWEIPEGGCPLNEPMLEGAKRELREETGIEAQDWELVQRLHTSNSVTDEEAFIFLATDLSFFEAELEPTEDIVTKKVSLTEAVQMVFNGQITDSLSVAGLLKVWAIKSDCLI